MLSSPAGARALPLRLLPVLAANEVVNCERIL